MAGVELARSESARGEMVLRRRAADDALELRVNGVFVMDTAETSAERALAQVALALWRARSVVVVSTGSTTELGAVSTGSATEGAPARVLVGGLGLGFTLDEVLRDPDVTEIVVAEIEPDLVRWHRRGLIPHTSSWLTDQRVQVVVADVKAVVPAQAAGTVDVLLLDVDNGPDNLVYDANAALYRRAFLRACRQAMSDVGVTAIWSADASDALRAELTGAFERVDEVAVPVRLGQRESTYTLLLASATSHRQPPFERRRSDTVEG